MYLVLHRHRQTEQQCISYILQNKHGGVPYFTKTSHLLKYHLFTCLYHEPGINITYLTVIIYSLLTQKIVPFTGS